MVGFESTGPYAEPLLHFLRKRNVRLAQVNPFHTKRLKELQGNSPSKTDQKDPKIIADIIELGHALTVIIPEGTVAELRRLTQARERGIQRRSMLMSQVQDLVFLIFPEFMPVMKDIAIKSAQYLLNHYPRPQDVVETGVRLLTQGLKKVSRGNLGKERAEALYQAAEASVGIREGQESIVIEIKEIISAIENIERFVKEVENHMGKHKGTRRISKRGRPLLRKLLFFASINVVRKGGILHAKCQLHLQKGMQKIKALVAISRKLLSIIFALVRDHSVYEVNYSKIKYSLKEAV